jgi:hypothetical protein
MCSRNERSNDTGVFVINALWLYQTLSPGSWLKQQALGVSNNWNSNCFLNIDCYVVNNNRYKWVCNIDTIVTSRGWLPNQCNHVLSSAFSSAIHFADSIFINKSYPDSQLTYADFNILAESQYNYPILTAEKFSKGIFNTYNDFLENNVSDMNVEIYFQKNKRCIKSTTVPDSVINKSWGFSDGESLFINVEGGYYKLMRSGNTFDLIGPRIIEYKTSLFNKATGTAITYFLITKPFIDPFNFAEPGRGMAEGFKLYQLNIRDGAFR